MIDREVTPIFTFQIRVMDRGTPSLSSTAMITVVIDDENDNAPVFFPFTTTAVVSELTENGSFLNTYTASDLDAGNNAMITYTILNRQLGP